MSTHEHLAQRYIALWNETDPAARRRGVEDLWSDDARYVDPLADAQGHEAIDATIAAVQGQFPGFEFRLASSQYYQLQIHRHQLRDNGRHKI